MDAARYPFGCATAPILITWAPFTWPAPEGARVASALAVAEGTVLLGESSTGARSGGAISTEEANAACQLLVGASVTTEGCVPGACEG